MKRKQAVAILQFTTLLSIFLIPFAIIKKPLKDWIIVYLVSILGNSWADRFLVSKGYLEYKIRPFRKKVSIHLPFDYLQYPLLLLYYNQWTLNSKPLGLFLKLFPFVIPQIIFETIAEKKTRLITWKKGYTWYHSLLSLMAKLLICRLIIALIRMLNKRSLTIKEDEI